MSKQSIINPERINPERLSQTFLDLVHIDSISKEEGKLAEFLLLKLNDLGAQTVVDQAGQKVGGQTGNIIAYFSGNRQAEPLLLAAHMDTVEPGRGVQAQINDGVFTSAGKTILGADDKSALAIILEVLQVIREQDSPCGPLEIIFTICEEIGLLGAKYLDYQKISARIGYALDTKSTQAIVTRAPAANRLIFRVHGKAAHAGSSPESGINAISLASRAIAQLELGRIDTETTCNIGVIEGGLATNIVPDLVVVKGEVRSHDTEKLNQVTEKIVNTFNKVIGTYAQVSNGADVLPKVETSVEHDFNCMRIDDTHVVVKMAQQAAANLGYTLGTVASGGGSDANIFAENELTVGVLGTGMDHVHTVKECVRLNDMVQTARLVLEILRLHAKS